MCRGVMLLVALVLAGCNLAPASQITPQPTPDLPQAAILDPPNNRQVFIGTTFDIDIVARDNNPGVARIALFVDDQFIHDAVPIEQSMVPVFRVKMNWLATGIGLHLIQAVAYRPDGTQSDPAVINIEVVPRD